MEVYLLDVVEGANPTCCKHGMYPLRNRSFEKKHPLKFGLYELG